MKEFSSLFRDASRRARIIFETKLCFLKIYYFRRHFKHKKVLFAQECSIAMSESLRHRQGNWPVTHSGPSLVIHFRYGGLGDHLLYSHIPRLAKVTGKFSKVFFSRKTPVRNEVYLKYIWEYNPYVDGFCDEANIVDVLPGNAEKENILDRIMLSYGIDDGLRWHEPELYFNPPLYPNLYESVVYDPNFISDNGGLNSKMVNEYFLKENMRVHFQFLFHNYRFVPVYNFDQFIADQSFEEFCGIIVSCSKLFSLTSGTATLSAALKKPATVFYGEKIKIDFLHSKLHQYVLLRK